MTAEKKVLDEVPDTPVKLREPLVNMSDLDAATIYDVNKPQYIDRRTVPAWLYVDGEYVER